MAKLAYTQAGGGPLPLVLLHGFPLDVRMWDAQIGALSNHARVIAPDLRGFGRSTDDSPFTMASLADDVHQLLRSIDALPCVLAGLSMGGYVALAYASKYASDLRGLALIDTKSTADDAEGRRARDQMIELARTQGAKAVADKMQPRMLAPSTLEQRPDVVAQLRILMEACPVKTIEHAQAAMRDRPDRTSILASLSAPVLIIVGEHDAITPPAAAEHMKQNAKQAELVVIKDAGHMSPMEQPEPVNAALRRVLALVRSPGTPGGG